MDDRTIEKNQDNEELQLTMVHKRLRSLGILFLFFFAVVLVRLFWIQFITADNYLVRGADQREEIFQSSIARGQIVDRNLIPFTDRELSKYIGITQYIGNKEETAALVAKASGYTKKEVLDKINAAKGPFEIESKEFSNAELSTIEKGMVKGVSILEKRKRYSDNSLARHVIGYINRLDIKGEAGIEKSMNSILEKSSGEKIVAIVDSYKNPIPSLGFRKVELGEEDINLGIKLTLDYHMQKIVEDVLKGNEINGAAVVMSIKNGDILAMASTPDYDQNNVGSFLNSKNDELRNKAISNYDLGSVFKTVVAAAAIENNILLPDETFLCEGEIKSGNNVFKCATYKTHENRPITFEEAFALSCNTTFINVGTRVGADKILSMAKRMGFGEKLCNELLDEASGNIPEVKDEGIGNISIGQGKIQVTPLQVTTMMAAIANNGIKNYPAIIDSVINNDTGKQIQALERSKSVRILDVKTTRKLQDMLHQVTLNGTAKQAALEEFGGSAGKTGSAETGIRNGEIVQGWFAGYVPTDKPLYAITVFVYDGKSGGKSAAPLFRDIAQRILTEYKPINKLLPWDDRD